MNIDYQVFYSISKYSFDKIPGWMIPVICNEFLLGNPAAIRQCQLD